MNSQKGPIFVNPRKLWRNLWDTTVQISQPDEHPDCLNQPAPKPDLPEQSKPIAPQNLGQDATALGLDLIPYPYDESIVRQKRLGLSSRKFEDAKRKLEEHHYIWIFPIGRWRFLVAFENLYRLFNISPLQELNPHSFAVNLACHCLRQDPAIDRLQKEGKVGDSNAAVDILVHLKDGFREAYEITLSAGNVPSNAAKLQNMGFSRIVFLCRDYKILQAAWASLRESGLPQGFLSRVRCILFSTLLKKYRAIEQEE